MIVVSEMEKSDKRTGIKYLHMNGMSSDISEIVKNTQCDDCPS